MSEADRLVDYLQCRIEEQAAHIEQMRSDGMAASSIVIAEELLATYLRLAERAAVSAELLQKLKGRTKLPRIPA